METLYKLFMFFGSIASIASLIFLIVIASYIAKSLAEEEQQQQLNENTETPERGLIDI